MTAPQPLKFPIEPPHVMTPAAMKRFAAAYYTGLATLAAAEAKQK